MIPLRAHKARVAREQGQEPYAQVGAQRVRDEVVDVDDAVGAGHKAEQARVLRELDEAGIIFANYCEFRKGNVCHMLQDTQSY